MIGSYIFIDTSAFMSGSYFKPTGRISKLFKLASQNRLQILLPEITKEEWLKHMRQDANLPCEDFIRKASLLGGTHRLDGILKAIESIDTNVIIEESLADQIAKANVLSIGYDYCTDVKGVFEKYFKQEKPFGKGKQKEFPDAFVLSSLEKYAKDNRIPKIYVLSGDGDMKEYRSEVLTPYKDSDFLDAILKEIADASEREKKDIETLNRCIKSGSVSCIKDIQDHIVDYLSNTGLYNNCVQWQEVEDVSVDKDIALSFNDGGLQLTDINEEYIEATCPVEIKVAIEVEHMDVADSYWDSEEKEYLFKNYATTEIDVSTSTQVTFRMDRTELDMGQDPKIELIDIDFEPIEEAIEGEEY